MKKKQEPRHVLEFFQRDSAKVRLIALLIDRLTVPRVCLAVACVAGGALKLFL
jgi:hypothetical protein